jgi:simple sugar transport system permease protein
VLIVVSTDALRLAWAHFFTAPGAALGDTFRFLGDAYWALIKGAVADPRMVRRALDQPTAAAWGAALRPLSNTITAAVPLAIAGAGLAIAFRSGTFNMGAHGQIVAGAIASSWVGFSLPGLAAPLHIGLGLAAGIAGGCLAGLIPGLLKAYAGAHEVLVTIMLNYVAANFLVYLLSATFFRTGGADGAVPTGRSTVDSARLPRIFGSSIAINLGLVIAVLTVAAAAVMLNRSRLGFELQIAGASKGASRIAGISQAKVYLVALTVSGGIIGLAGAVQMLGVTGQLQTTFGGDLGYLAILVAFVGRSRPGGVALAALLYGALQSGGLSMQFATGISYQLTNVIQALIVFFVTAPALVAAIYRLLPQATRASDGAAAPGTGSPAGNAAGSIAGNGA